MEQFNFSAPDSLNIYAYKWSPDVPAKGVVIIVHGSVEHALRYREFAEELIKNGYLVYSYDQRGHGVTGEHEGDLGHLALGKGWNMLLDDLNAFYKHIAHRHPEQTLILFGHSMGSMIVRDFIGNYPHSLAGAVICGTNFARPGKLTWLLRAVAAAAKVIPAHKPSPFMHDLVYADFTKSVKPRKTRFDFVSRDPDEVQAYINDPYCGVTITPGHAHEIGYGALHCSHPETFAGTPKSLPILIIAGTRDPVGDMGKSPNEVYRLFKENSLQDVTLKLYEGARHEILHETNKAEVMEDVVRWMNQQISR